MGRKTQSIQDKLSEEFGEFLFVTDETEKEVEVLSTGSLSLNVSTGIGGIPKGRITTIWGAEGSGKTSLCLEVVNEALKEGKKVCYIDVENSLDFMYVEAILGEYDSSNLMIVQPEDADQALTIAEIAIQGSKKRNIEPGQFAVVVVDSVPALATAIEKKKELVDSSFAPLSRLLGTFFKRNMFAIRQNKVVVIFVNQVRASMKMYGSPVSMPGGHALQHYSSLIVFLSKIGKIKKGDNTIGMYSKFVVQKNKLAPPLKTNQFPIMYGKGIDYYRDVVEFASAIGKLKKRGSYFLYEDENIGQGMVETMEYLENHKDTLDKLIESCYTDGVVEEFNEDDLVMEEEEELDE